MAPSSRRFTTHPPHSRGCSYGLHHWLATGTKQRYPSPKRNPPPLDYSYPVTLRLYHPLSVCLYYYQLPHYLSLPPSLSVPRPLTAPPVFPQHGSRGVYPQAAPTGGSHSATALQCRCSRDSGPPLIPQPGTAGATPREPPPVTPRGSVKDCPWPAYPSWKQIHGP